MSYDLYLSSETLTADSFSRYFVGRRGYENPGWYANEDTGVYFSFTFEEPDTSESEEEVLSAPLLSPHAAFNLNYFRPHIFALEAEPEVSAFVAAFGCHIHDPQTKGMGDGPYSREGFLSGWNAGNAFGYRALAGQNNDGSVLVAEDARIEAVWRWNADLEAARSANGDQHFLPRVSWARDASGHPLAYFVWGEGVPTAAPACASHALLARERAPTFFSKGGFQARLMPVADVEALEGCRWIETTRGRLLHAPHIVPPSRAVMGAFEHGFGPIDNVLTRVAADHVLNVSLMPKA